MTYESEEGELINSLCRLGLTPLQSKLYIALAANGPNSARFVIQKLGINRVDVYRVLRSLRKLGLVEIILQNPSIFSAVSPKFAIEQLLKERERRLVDARNEAPQIVETLEQISLIGKKKVDMTDGLAQHHFRLKYGEQVFEKRKQLVINANEEILVICSGVGFKILAGRGWLDCFREASSRGVLIRAITEVTADNSKEIQALSHLADTRIGENLFSTLRFMVVDSSEVLLSATSVPVMEDELVALWTDNQPIARGFIEDFERCWNTSFPFLDYIAKARIK